MYIMYMYMLYVYMHITWITCTYSIHVHVHVHVNLQMIMITQSTLVHARSATVDSCFGLIGPHQPVQCSTRWASRLNSRPKAAKGL